MRVSTLRVRLAGGFALAFAIGLALLAAFGLAYLWRESTRRFDVHLDAVVGEVIGALQREQQESPDSSLTFVASEVAAEWSDVNDAFVVLSVDGERLGSFDPAHVGGRIADALRNAPKAERQNLTETYPDLRLRIADVAPFQSKLRPNRLTNEHVRIVTFGSTEGIETDSQLLGVLFAVSAPFILLISLVAGYMLSGRALKPVRELADAMSAIAPTDLDKRLPTEGNSADEVSAVATEFNALLARLQETQRRNGQFVRETAHQIRTPLTLVLGETTHAIENDAAVSDPARMHATLGRIRTAAEVMRRRVDELFLLAEARTGEAVRLEQQVELDSLVLECTDLMRARASETGHRLAIGKADAIVITGHAALLQEALLEMLENACKYGDTSKVITVSCKANVGFHVLSVASGGKSFEIPARNSDERLSGGMGLSIVRWVAESHHGEMRVVRMGDVNELQLVFPVRG
ncbi:MAG: HAMP domain-containing sensor histidine kinase [Gemmatimonadaceae bacterium]